MESMSTSRSVRLLWRINSLTQRILSGASAVSNVQYPCERSTVRKTSTKEPLPFRLGEANDDDNSHDDETAKKRRTATRPIVLERYVLNSSRALLLHRIVDYSFNEAYISLLFWGNYTNYLFHCVPGCLEVKMRSSHACLDLEPYWF